MGQTWSQQDRPLPSHLEFHIQLLLQLVHALPVIPGLVTLFCHALQFTLQASDLQAQRKSLNGRAS